jgi:hypothetical protein
LANPKTFEPKNEICKENHPIKRVGLAEDIVQLNELKAIVQAAGGGCNALEYAEPLLKKINRLEGAGGYETLLAQLQAAKEEGDFRGRVLEVNFANLFVEAGTQLQYGAKQGMLGDVDFCWCVGEYQIFIEMKLLGQDKKSKEAINQQLTDTGFYRMCVLDDTYDIARIQRDIFEKSSIKKFNPLARPNWINIVAVDVSELQLGTVDIGDCLLAAVGNEITAKYCHPICLRPAVVGVFESAGKALSPDQVEWVKYFHKFSNSGNSHPRDYIHGILFLFRHPEARAALNYDLSAEIAWNAELMNESCAKSIFGSLRKIVPAKKNRT